MAEFLKTIDDKLRTETSEIDKFFADTPSVAPEKQNVSEVDKFLAPDEPPAPKLMQTASPEAFSLAKKTQYPISYVERNKQKVQGEYEDSVRTKFLEENPTVAGYVQVVNPVFAKSDEEYERLTFLGKIWSKIKYGHYGQKAATYNTLASSTISRLESVRESLNRVLRYEGGDLTAYDGYFAPGMKRMLIEDEKFRDRFIKGHTQELTNIPDRAEDHANTAIDYLIQQQKTPRDPKVRELEQLKTFSEKFSRFSENPLRILSNVFLESLSPMGTQLASGVTGALLTRSTAGFTGGTFAGSLDINRSSKILEGILEKNPSINSASDLLKIYGDRQAMAKIESDALLYSSPVAILDAWSAGMATKMLGRTPVRNVLAQTGVQSFGGAFGDFAGQSLQKGMANVDLFDSFLEGILEIPGGFAEIGIGSALRKYKGKHQARIDNANHTVNAVNELDSLVNTVKDSQQRKADPQSYNEFVKRVTEGAENQSVNINADDLQTYFQTNPEFEAQIKAASPDFHAKYLASLKTRGNFSISVPEYLSYLSDQHDKLRDLISFGDNPTTVADAVKVVGNKEQDLKNLLDEIKGGLDQTQKRDVGTQQIYDDVVSQLTTQSLFNQDVAQAYAANVASTMRSLATRAGLEPLELYKRVGLQTINNALNGVPTNNVDTILKNLRGFTPTPERLLRGASITEALIDSKIVTAEQLSKIKPGSKLAKKVTAFAIEQGYIGPHATSRGAVRAIKREQSGTPVHAAKNIDRQAIEREAAFNALLDVFARENVDINDNELAPAVVQKILDNDVKTDGEKFNQSDKVDEISARWKKALKKVSSRNMDYVPIFPSPSILKEFGITSKTVGLPTRVLLQILLDHPDIPRSVFDNLPKLIADPILIYEHKEGGQNFLIDEKSTKGSPIVVGVRDGKITTVTPLDSYNGLSWGDRVLLSIEKKIEEKGRTKIYAANEKTLTEVRASSLQSRTFPTGQYKLLNIITRDDLVNKYGDQFYQNKGSERGSIQFPSKGIGTGPTIISLTQNKDFSTFLHESGHLYFETMRTLAQTLPADNSIVKDLAQIKDWFLRNIQDTKGRQRRNGSFANVTPGIVTQFKAHNPTFIRELTALGGDAYIQQFIDGGQTAQTDLDRAIMRELHEYFARGYEAYLREGRAPSQEMRGVFQNFRAWLIHIYRSVKNLAVNLDDSIRAVFDRMTAVDEEIVSARSEEQNDRLFDSPDGLKIDEQAWADYLKAYDNVSEDARQKADEKLIKAYQRVQDQGKYKRVRAQAKRDVTFLINAQREYQAIYFLATGDNLDENSPINLPAVKLSYGTLQEMYGETYGTVAAFENAILKKLPGEKSQKIWAKKSGEGYDLVHPDVVARLYGYDSADAMIKAIIGLPSRQSAIKTLTEMEIAKRLGDPVANGEIPAVVRESMEFAKEKFILAELNIINKKAGLGPTPIEAAKQLAKETINNMPVGEVVRVTNFRSAELRAMRKARDAIAKGDYQEAARQERIRLLQHYIYTEALRVTDRVDKTVNHFSKFNKPGTRKNLDADALLQIDGLLDRFGFRSMADKKIAKRLLLDYLSNPGNTEAQIGASEVPPDMEFAPEILEETYRTHYKELSVAQFNDLRDMVKLIETLARNQKAYITEKGRIDFEMVKADLITAATDNMISRKEDPLDPNLKTFKGEFGKKKRAAASFLLGMEQVFDWLDGGTVDGPWKKYVFGAIAQAEHFANELNREIAEPLIDLLSNKLENAYKRESMVFIQSLGGSLTKATRIAMMLNIGNESNYNKLINGSANTRLRITPAVIEEVKATLSKEDWDMIQGIWDQINVLWPTIERTVIQATGLRPAKVEAREVVTPYGNYRGGYYPVVYDRSQSNQGEKQAELGAFGGGYGTARPASGFTKSRNEGAAFPILLDLAIIPRHINMAIHYISNMLPVRNINKILFDNDIKDVINKKLGDEYFQEMRKWIDRVSKNNSLVDGAAGWLNEIRRNWAVATMGLSVTTSVSQAMGYFNSEEIFLKPDINGNVMGTGYLLEAIATYYSNMGDTESMVHELSGEMKFRAKTIDRDLAELQRKLVGKHGSLKNIQDFSMRPIAYMDALVATPTWLGAYRWANDQGYSQADAIEYADSRVRLSQSTGSLKDISRAQDTQLIKLITVAYGFFRAFLGRQLDIANDIKLHGIRGSNAISRIHVSMFLAPLITALILLRTPKCKDSDPGCYAAWMTAKVLTNFFSGIPGFRDAVGGIEAGLSKYTGNRSFQYSGTALTEQLEQLSNVFKYTIRGEGGKAFKAGIKTIAYAKGIPYVQPERTGSYIMDYMSGKERDFELQYLFFRKSD